MTTMPGIPKWKSSQRVSATFSCFWLMACMRGSVKDPVARVELDMSWHEALIGSAGNRYASTLLAGAKNLIRRYEYAYMREAGQVPISVGMHNEILAAAKAGDREHVVLLLEDHWRSGMRAVEDWLSKREAVTAR